MAHQGYKVMDSDMHLIEPHDLWQRYIDPAYKASAPIGANVVPRDARVYVAGMNPADTPKGWGGYLAQHVMPQKDDYALADERCYDNVSQLDAMDKEGIDVAVLFPSRGLFVLGIDSTETAGEKGYRPEVRHRDRPRLQRLAIRFLRARPQAFGRHCDGGAAHIDGRCGTRRAVRSWASRRCFCCPVW